MEKIESYFRFEITQTTRVLLYKMRMGDGKRWQVEGKEQDGVLFLHQLEKPENMTKVVISSNVLRITTVRGFEYVIFNKEKDGAEVSFHGPLNALMMQSLMPKMTYVPKTLVGMNSLMDDYVPIGEYMRLRSERHNNTGEVNPQDRFGWKLNYKFNNELVPWFPRFNGNKKVPSEKTRKGKFSRR